MRPPVTVTAIAVAVTGALAGSAGSAWVVVSEHHSVISTVFGAALALSFVIVGSVIVGARPGNLVGWLLLAAGPTWALGAAGVDLGRHGIVVRPGSVPGASAFAVAASAVRSVGWYLVTLVVPAYFPNGRLAGSRVRWLKPVLIIIVVAAVVDPLTDKQADLTDFGPWRNPISLPRPWDIVSGVAFLGHVPLALVAAGGIIVGLRDRWRRGDRITRQQLLMFFAAVAVPAVAAPVAVAVSSVGSWIFPAAALPLPFVVGFAVLARDVYDLRTAANRTLVWATLTATVVGVYALLIAGLGGLVDARGASRVAWLAAAVLAVSIVPLRDVLQRGINRITYGRWNEPYDVLAALGQRLEATADIDRLLADVVTELHDLGLSGVSVCDRYGQVLAGSNTVHADVVEHALAAFGQPIGALRYETPNPPLRGRDRQLLDDLAGHLGGVLHARQLTSDLQRALEQQVLGREEERRRLRRDLHDGLGPALAGHVLRLDAVSAKLEGDSPAHEDLEALRRELRTTMLEVRRVVEGLRPPALDELGLPSALEQAVTRLTAGSPVTATVDTSDLPSLPAAMEVAVYRIATEAVTNVVRHAGASRCDVSVRTTSGMLRLMVSDNGRGLDSSRTTLGNGLQTMRERAEQLRGRLHIATGDGTVVTAELPVATT